MAMPRQRLRQLREEAGKSQAEVALAVNVSERTYIAWERGEREPRVGYRPALARILNQPLSEIDRALGMRPLNGHSVPSWLDHLASLEQGAQSIHAFEPVVVYGLLQTSDYAAAVERTGLNAVTDADVAERVGLRLRRQQVLERHPNPLDLWVVLDESVLRRRTGDDGVMADQLARLVELSDLRNVTVQVLPFDGRAHCAAFGAFRLFTKEDSDEPYMACVEDAGGPHYLDRSGEVPVHVSLFEHLAHMALSPTESIDRIEAVRKEQYL